MHYFCFVLHCTQKKLCIPYFVQIVHILCINRAVSYSCTTSIYTTKKEKRTIARFFFYFLAGVFLKRMKNINNNIYHSVFLRITHIEQSALFIKLCLFEGVQGDFCANSCAQFCTIFRKSCYGTNKNPKEITPQGAKFKYKKTIISCYSSFFQL